MNQLYLPVDVLFDQTPDPVFLWRDQAMVYRNPAGAAIFPDSVPGGPLPEPLRELPQEGAAAISVGERDYRALTLLWEGQVLARLQEETGAPILPNHRLPLLAHKLRGLLASFSGSSEQLEALLSASGLESEASDPLSRGTKAQYRLLRLVRSLELLSLGPFEAPYSFQPDLLDLQGLCHDAWRHLTSLAGELQCTVTYAPKPGNYLVLCDEQLLLLQIYHLASNAFRATGAGGVLSIRLEKKGSQAHIILEDNGPGLSQEAMAALFDPARGGESLKEQALGAGLGLGISVCRKIASLHEGAVLFSNCRSKGLRAVISLPLRHPGDCACLESPRTVVGEAGGELVLRELSDLLPFRCFRPENL